MNILRNAAIILTGLVILGTPMTITAYLVISHDPQNAMGNVGGLLFGISAAAGIGLVALADRFLNRF
jgi:hypothetical protein